MLKMPIHPQAHFALPTSQLQMNPTLMDSIDLLEENVTTLQHCVMECARPGREVAIAARSHPLKTYVILKFAGHQ
jgi:hypothetical protein